MTIETTHLHPQDYLRSQWKNGLGHTDQIAIHPPGADLRRGDFLWRISTAHVAQSSPFSNFPEHDRLLIVLEGSGLNLYHTYEPEEEPEQVELSPLEPYEFPGDVPTRCELQGSPIQDFSVFFRKGVVSAQAEILLVAPGRPLTWTPESQVNLLYIAEGSVRINAEDFGRGDSLQLDLTGNISDSEPRNFQIEATSGTEDDPVRLVLVRLDPFN